LNIQKLKCDSYALRTLLKRIREKTQKLVEIEDSQIEKEKRLDKLV